MLTQGAVSEARKPWADEADSRFANPARGWLEDSLHPGANI